MLAVRARGIQQRDPAPTCIDDMVANWQLAIATVQAVGAIGRGPLGYFGFSIGSIFGVPLVAVRSDVTVAALGLLGSSAATGSLGGRLLADRTRIVCPVLFLMQLLDELFDRTGYLTRFDALAATDKQLHANPGRTRKSRLKRSTSHSTFCARICRAGRRAAL